ncbi:MAG: hypothetical protein KDD42_07335, partial [Bdellovibrionales bacterium]|nr:hypothetical protein [Bdellovibrionales bacterium]
MRILHVGGLRPITDLLTTHQSAAGHTVTNLAEVSVGRLFSEEQQQIIGSEIRAELLNASSLKGHDTPINLLPEDNYDVIHFHSLSAFNSLAEELKALISNSQRIKLFLSYHEPLFALHRGWLDQLQDSLKSLVRIYHYGFQHHSALHSRGLNSTWLGAPFPYESLEAKPPSEPAMHQIKILHIVTRSTTAELIQTTLQNVKASGLRFFYAQIPADMLEDQESLQLRLKECDLYIDDLAAVEPSFFAYIALAQGTAVLSNLHPDS